MKYRLLVLVSALVILGLLAGCGGNGGDVELGLIVEDGQTVAAPARGKVAPDFRLETLDGEVVRLSDYQGQPVMLNFWASWCGPCQEEIPHMVEAYAEDSGFEIVAVNVHEATNRVEAFVDSTGMTFPVLLDADASVATGYVVRGIPTSLFLDSSGVIVAIHEGTLTEAQLRDYLDVIVQ